MSKPRSPRKEEVAAIVKEAEKAVDQEPVVHEVEEARKALAKRVMEGSSAGGLVRAFASGDQTLVSIEIAPEAIAPAQGAELRSMVLEAVNHALTRSKELTREVLDQAAGGIRIPGL